MHFQSSLKRILVFMYVLHSDPWKTRFYLHLGPSMGELEQSYPRRRCFSEASPRRCVLRGKTARGGPCAPFGARGRGWGARKRGRRQRAAVGRSRSSTVRLLRWRWVPNFECLSFSGMCGRFWWGSIGQCASGMGWPQRARARRHKWQAAEGEMGVARLRQPWVSIDRVGVLRALG